MMVREDQDLMITCKSGITIRMPVSGISEQGRATQGVKLIRIEEGDDIAAISKLDEQEEIPGENEDMENKVEKNDADHNSSEEKDATLNDEKTSNNGDDNP
jgi:DNA gyrase subunit A